LRDGRRCASPAGGEKIILRASPRKGWHVEWVACGCGPWGLSTRCKPRCHSGVLQLGILHDGESLPGQGLCLKGAYTLKRAVPMVRPFELTEENFLVCVVEYIGWVKVCTRGNVRDTIPNAGSAGRRSIPVGIAKEQIVPD
jgi:hypothetical protein